MDDDALVGEARPLALGHGADGYGRPAPAIRRRAGPGSSAAAE